ncbi:MULTISPECIES: hypothetical protein [unclassified Micromonospora]|uniref:hypothetical protein n=1 Tax=unclassified Micromonospora TaxID=2617518 RepID=UPI0022B6E377|nr:MULTISPECIES: hypothetical protein [unclassified Micromonospora]MCZ7420174.1 hypothetical protein [Verrucosispora sp. WMMA2121]WBB89310.1 hypothetical protein O7597_20095 [Verrucosispora sp. WMMC514]
MKNSYGPVWLWIVLSVACFSTGLYAFTVDHPYLFGLALIAALAAIVMAYRAASRRRGLGLVGREAGQAVDLTNRVAVVLVIAFGLLAVASSVFMVVADGNLSAYILGGAVLVVALFAVITAVTGEKKP